MNLELRGKTAVVTGSTAGIGLAIALALAEEGAAVAVNGRTAARVAAAEAAIRRKVKDAELRGVAADLGTAAGAAEFVRQVPQTDILVNNLGIYAAKPFLEISDSEWTEIFEVNVMSGVRLARHYLPGMLRRNWGRVIFISSESAQHIPPEMVHYGMTKTAQLAIARGLAEGVAGTRITVNSVLAGPTASEGVTAFVADMAKQRGLSTAEIESDFFKTVRPTSLLKRFETPEEIAAVVAFVASTRSIAINGAAVRAEGGVVRSIL
ncbi:MAG TPA: SDR family NAD(P)-dependent oxidoreductase [Candidatus Acidoferrales bacterium]|nr:SDR family NAD(P)-dependent oxidoreductase [Candidatus Acidoferrales bacterium]